MKPVIVIIDDDWDLRRPVFEQLLGDQVEIRSFKKFTRRDIDRKTLSSGIATKPTLLGLNPCLIIGDLSLLEEVEDPDPGISLLETLRTDPELKNFKIMVVSDYANDPAVADRLNRVGINHIVYYQSLLTEGSPGRAVFARGLQEALDRE